MLTDTIAAISTGGTNAGINIIRISGTKSKKAIKKIFKSAKRLEHQKIIYGKIIDSGTKKEIDEVLVSCFMAPNSFTGETVFEINCHGGRNVTTKILKEVISQDGVRLALPGEFSKRAFINGKIDLSKAEAIADVINAKTNIQSRIAINQLNGKLFEKIEAIKGPLLYLIANIEVGIDYPEYEYEELKESNIIKVLEGAKKHIGNLIRTFDEGKYIKDGINVAIIGAPNVGKSSLMNALAKEERSIVTDVAGTTRDIVEQKIILGNMELNILDTAGIRKTEDLIEQIGVKKSLKALEGADIIVFMVDASKGIDKEEEDLIKTIKALNKPLITCLNKTDISCETQEMVKKGKENKLNMIEMSIKTGKGLGVLIQNIEKHFNKLGFDENTEEIIINERHRNLLGRSERSIGDAIKGLKESKQIDIVSVDIKEAISSLLEITGEEVSEEIIQTIFKSFCLGK